MWKNARWQHFNPFPQCFLPTLYSKTFHYNLGQRLFRNLVATNEIAHRNDFQKNCDKNEKNF